MYIEAIQSLRSLIIVIHYDHGRNLNTTHASILRQIFAVIFHISNLVQTWGNPRLKQRDFVMFDLFIAQQLIEVYSLVKQQQFQRWYNRLFRHHASVADNADRMKEYHRCSCTFPQYLPNRLRQWSLSEAIALVSMNHAILICSISINV